MFGTFGWMELLLILIIVLIIFGAGKIPQLGEGLGKAIKGFKKSVAEADALDVTPEEQAESSHPSTSGQSTNQGQVAQAPPPSQQAGEPQPAQSSQHKQG